MMQMVTRREMDDGNNWVMERGCLLSIVSFPCQFALNRAYASYILSCRKDKSPYVIVLGKQNDSFSACDQKTKL